jgi:glycolate oxidase FAD binding subunit
MSNLDAAVQDLCNRIDAARAAGTPLRIRGGASKAFFSGDTSARVLDTRALRGILSYEPSELVVTVAAGTPLTELEAELARHGQCLPFEPPYYRWSQPDPAAATVGGMVASGLAGPARASVGGVRDYVLGLEMVNGLGQRLRFGGQVMKNVAGYDVSRLMAGSLGTLGLITEVSLKVLPVAPAEATVVFEMDQASALEQLHRWGARPLPLNASCWVHDPAQAGQRGRDLLFVRLRGASAAVQAACASMLAEQPGERMDTAQAAADWELCRNHLLPFFAVPDDPALVLWRLSLPQTAAPLALPWPQLVEWHGALRWLWAPMAQAGVLQAAAEAVGGSASLFVAPAQPACVHERLRVEPAAMAAIAARLKASFDPQGIFNPGLFPSTASTAHANPARA